MHVNPIVRNIKVGEILKELKVFFSHILDVHSCKFRSYSFVRQLYSARVEQQEPVQNT